MKVKDDKISRVVNAMFLLMNRMKAGMDECCLHNDNKLNEKEFFILTFIGSNKNAKMSEISEALSTPLSTLTSIIDKLVNGKYLERYHSSEDRRVVLVTLAKNGKEIYQYTLEKKMDLGQRMLSEYSETEQEELISYLENIPKSLDK